MSVTTMLSCDSGIIGGGSNGAQVTFCCVDTWTCFTAPVEVCLIFMYCEPVKISYKSVLLYYSFPDNLQWEYIWQSEK